ncbi:unnamed protein product [Pieris brassicae]|uniref:Uncharacterized protein n=1 Tax=Pieris brassicae TaxID=7116 RepID=A0A9P0T4R8_PIEBR|nr:unnamed protein product [Pieris brassicae]
MRDTNEAEQTLCWNLLTTSTRSADCTQEASKKLMSRSCAHVNSQMAGREEAGAAPSVRTRKARASHVVAAYRTAYGCRRSLYGHRCDSR